MYLHFRFLEENKSDNSHSEMAKHYALKAQRRKGIRKWKIELYQLQDVVCHVLPSPLFWGRGGVI